MYDGDSFFTLSLWGRAGLVTLSILLACLWLRVTYELHRLPRAFAAICALALFWTFAWLSPQVYYAYYRLLFDGLPQQWVAQFPEISTTFRTLTFSGRATLSAHTLGLLGWAMLGLAILSPRRNAAC